MARDRFGGQLNFDLMAPRHGQEMDSWLNSSCVAGSPVRRPTVYHPKPQRTREPGLHWNPSILAQLAGSRNHGRLKFWSFLGWAQSHCPGRP